MTGAVPAWRPSTSPRTRFAALWRVSILPLALALTVLAPPAVTSAADAPHLGAEKYALKLINCTRTGGWVRQDGTCKDYGTGKHSVYRKPLKLSTLISDGASRPYAVTIAAADYCDHYYNGTDPSSRLNAAGITGSAIGENVGCGWGYTPRGMVLATHLGMQAEKATNGGHWQNFKNAAYRKVGIGVAASGTTTRIVEDYWAP